MFAVVLLSDTTQVYGPFESRDLADQFATFLTEEVDPAEVFPLCSPTAELLRWREAIHAQGARAVERIVADVRQGRPPSRIYPLDTP
jgi:hypothetical protein